MTDTMILFAASLAFALGALLLASAGLRRSAITGGRNRLLERQLADQGLAVSHEVPCRLVRATTGPAPMG